MKRTILLAVFISSAQLITSQQSDLDRKISESRELKALIQSDPHRPIYHFTAPEGHAYPFDPNGAIYWKGKYHLGYIYQKFRYNRPEHVWGHAVSTDLFHWTLYPDMLNIKDGDIERGIFSGGTFLSRDGIPHIMYHGEGASSNMVAYSTDDELKVWKKFEGNPILVTPAENSPMAGKYTAWDPEGWYDKKTDYYYQIAGGNPAALFKSKDMYKWEYLGDFISPVNRKNHLFEDISCPDFFKIGNKDILVFISHYMGTQYYIGTFSNDRYHIEKYGRMNWPGGTFFAPEQLVDDKGRNIIWGWVLERKPANLPNFGWSGIMSLPRVLTLSPQNELLINPPEEIKILRLNPVNEDPISMKPNESLQLKAKGKSMEIKMEIKGGQKSPFGVKVFCSPDKREETVIKYDPQAKELVIDFIRSSVNAPIKMLKYCMMHYPPAENAEGEISEQRAPLALQPGERLKLDIFIDRSIIEVFANGRQCMTQVVYPELPESTGIQIFSSDEAIQASNITIWDMAASNAY